MSNDIEAQKPEKRTRDLTIPFAIAIGPICLVGSAFLGWHINSDGQGRYITLLIQLAGMSSGAFLGFLASPKAPGEQVAFLTFAKAISAFLSGYALSKINSLIDTLINGEIYKDKDQLVGPRLLIFFVAMIISFMVAYSYRVYVQKGSGSVDAETAKSTGRSNDAVPKDE
jgi:hypothetical protein